MHGVCYIVCDWREIDSMRNYYVCLQRVLPTTHGLLRTTCLLATVRTTPPTTYHPLLPPTDHYLPASYFIFLFPCLLLLYARKYYFLVMLQRCYLPSILPPRRIVVTAYFPYYVIAILRNCCVFCATCWVPFRISSSVHAYVIEGSILYPFWY